VLSLVDDGSLFFLDGDTLLTVGLLIPIDSLTVFGLLSDGDSLRKFGLLFCLDTF
jgi:hypothetical protein